MDSAKGNTGERKKERKKEKERLYFHCAVEMKQPHTMAVPSPKKQGNIRGSLSRRFQPPLYANGECPRRLAPLDAFPRPRFPCFWKALL